MHRFRDLPGVMDLERKARLFPALATDNAIAENDAINDLSTALFGKTYFELDDDLELPDDSPVFHNVEAEEAAAFAAAGWDVTDELGRPLLVFKHFEYQLAYFLAGHLSFRPGILEGAGVEAWEDQMAAEAAKWRRKR